MWAVIMKVLFCAGRHVVVSTSTASGKSLCYNVPVIEALAADRGSTAIYIFPTKALAQDQMRALRGFLGGAFPDETPIADVYDGDTAKVIPPPLHPSFAERNYHAKIADHALWAINQSTSKRTVHIGECDLRFRISRLESNLSSQSKVVCFV